MKSQKLCMAAFCCAFAVHLLQAAAQDESPPEYVKQCAAKVKEKIALLQKQVKTLKYDERAKVRDELTRLTKGEIELYDLCGALKFSSLEVGQFGNVARDSVEVISVLEPGAVVAMPRERVRQIIRSGSAEDLNSRIQSALDRGPQYKYGDAVIVRQVPRAMADGAMLGGGTYEVVGTESYETIAGEKKTCYVLKPIDLIFWMPQIKELAGIKVK